MSINCGFKNMIFLWKTNALFPFHWTCLQDQLSRLCQAFVECSCEFYLNQKNESLKCDGNTNLRIKVVHAQVFLHKWHQNDESKPKKEGQQKKNLLIKYNGLIFPPLWMSCTEPCWFKTKLGSRPMANVHPAIFDEKA